MGRRTARGFTLLEVLAALAVLALALAAAIKAVGEGAENAAYLRAKTIAHWVALNRLAELQLATPWPEPGQSDGRTAMAGTQWHWEAKVEATDDDAVRRAEVTVAAAEERAARPIAAVTGYLGRREPPPRQEPGARP